MMITYTSKVIEVTNVTRIGSAYSLTDDGENCYISVAMAEACDVREGDKYQATLRPNYPERQDIARWIAVRLHQDHENTVLVEDDNEEVVEQDDYAAEEFLEEVVTTTQPEKVVEPVTATPSLRTMRDQMFTILLNMDNSDLDDMILETLDVDPMGFVDVLWSVLSINPIPLSAMNEVQHGCYTKVQSRCDVLARAGKLVEARYTTHNTEGKAHTSLVYGRRMEQLNPTVVV